MPGLLLVMTGKLVEEGDGTSARTTVEPYGFVGVRGILLRCEPDEKEVLATWEMSSRCRLARTSPLIRVVPGTSRSLRKCLRCASLKGHSLPPKTPSFRFAKNKQLCMSSTAVGAFRRHTPRGCLSLAPLASRSILNSTR
jgi:hypothetical protein